jgi:hypothetical protein
VANGDKKIAAEGPQPKGATRPEVWNDPIGAIKKAGLETIGGLQQTWNPAEKAPPPGKGKPVGEVWAGLTGKEVPPSDEEIATQQVEQEQAERLARKQGFDLGGYRDLNLVPAGWGEQVSAFNAPQNMGSRTTSRTRSAATPEQMSAMAMAYDYEARAAAAQLEARAAGMGLQMDVWNDLALDQQEQVFPLLQEATKIFDDAEKQMLGIQELMDDVRSNRINPGQFFRNIGEAGVFAASMVAAAGHLASAMGGGPNTALGVINGAIERNMRAQSLNQAHDRAVLQAEMMVFDRMRTMGVDRLNQANVYNALLHSQAQSALEAITAATSSVELRAQMGIVQAQLAQKKMDYIIQAMGSITAQTTMKIAGVSQAAQAGIKQSPVETALAVAQQYVSKLPEGQPINEAELADNMRNAFAALGQSPNPAEMQVIRSQFFSPDVESNVIRPIEEGQAVKVHDNTTGETRSYVPTAEFEARIPKNQKDDAIKMFKAHRNLVETWRRLEEFAETVKSTSGFRGGISKYAVWTREGGWDVKGTKNVPPGAYTVQRMLNDLTTQTLMMQSGRVEAVRGPEEFPVLQLRAGVPADAQTLLSIVSGSKWEDQIKPSVDAVYRDFKTTWAPLMSGVEIK